MKFTIIHPRIEYCAESRLVAGSANACKWLSMEFLTSKLGNEAIIVLASSVVHYAGASGHAVFYSVFVFHTRLVAN